MAEQDRLTKEQWQDLEPYLAEAEERARREFFASEQARAVIGDSQETPGLHLLNRLKASQDAEAIRLFRLTELYQHEIARADIVAAFLRGFQLGGERGAAKAAPEGRES